MPAFRGGGGGERVAHVASWLDMMDGQSSGAYEEVDPYEVMVEQLRQLNEATRAMSELHAQLLGQNAKLCLAASTSSGVMSSMARLAASGHARQP